MRHDLPDAPPHEVSPSTSLWVSGPGAKETPEDALARYRKAYPERQMTHDEILRLAESATAAAIAEPIRTPTAEEMLASYRAAYPERQACLSPDGKSLRIVLTTEPYAANVIS